MSLLKNLMWILKNRELITKLSGEVDKVTDSAHKDGVKTSEFLMVLLSGAVGVLGLTEKMLPPDVVAMCGTAIVISYMGLRTYLKVKRPGVVLPPLPPVPGADTQPAPATPPPALPPTGLKALVIGALAAGLLTGCAGPQKRATKMLEAQVVDLLAERENLKDKVNELDALAVRLQRAKVDAESQLRVLLHSDAEARIQRFLNHPHTCRHKNLLLEPIPRRRE